MGMIGLGFQLILLVALIGASQICRVVNFNYGARVIAYAALIVFCIFVISAILVSMGLPLE